MNRLQRAEQLRRAIQMLAANLTDDEAVEVSYVYDEWQVGRKYKSDGFVRYGTNGVGDPQMYKVVQDHTSQADWTPDKTPTLYVAIGLDEGGYPIWSRPTGAHDAYNASDIVNYNGELMRSLIDGNVWSPDELPSAWEKVI